MAAYWVRSTWAAEPDYATLLAGMPGYDQAYAKAEEAKRVAGLKRIKASSKARTKRG